MSGMHEAVTHARGGRQVLVLAQRTTTLLEEAADIAGADAYRITRANGQESISFRSGGSIYFVGRREGSVRGYSADVVYLPDWRMIHDEAFMEDLLPVFATAEHQRIGVLA